MAFCGVKTRWRFADSSSSSDSSGDEAIRRSVRTPSPQTAPAEKDTTGPASSLLSAPSAPVAPVGKGGAQPGGVTSYSGRRFLADAPTHPAPDGSCPASLLGGQHKAHPFGSSSSQHRRSPELAPYDGQHRRSPELVPAGEKDASCSASSLISAANTEEEPLMPFARCSSLPHGSSQGSSLPQAKPRESVRAGASAVRDDSIWRGFSSQDSDAEMNDIFKSVRKTPGALGSSKGRRRSSSNRPSSRGMPEGGGGAEGVDAGVVRVVPRPEGRGGRAAVPTPEGREGREGRGGGALARGVVSPDRDADFWPDREPSPESSEGSSDCEGRGGYEGRGGHEGRGGYEGRGFARGTGSPDRWRSSENKTSRDLCCSKSPDFRQKEAGGRVPGLQRARTMGHAKRCSAMPAAPPPAPLPAPVPAPRSHTADAAYPSPGCSESSWGRGNSGGNSGGTRTFQ
ncbi:hypothetical protein T484DRAFT_1954322 [Baffinella frigidus]|nr:hypothetical protein T484DRAFT_1954322 [Cryptophyta sp. CCMP2293]